MKPEMLHSLFNPSSEHVALHADCGFGGMEYVVARQIIREHDENFGHVGCRIKAEPSAGGYTVWFTLPKEQLEIETYNS
jgi:hypothetical protein